MFLFSGIIFSLASFAQAFPQFVKPFDDALAVRSQAHSGHSGLTLKHFLWEEPGENDVRSPCPFMNTLANHDFVNHSGRDITRHQLVKGCVEAFNIDPEFAGGIFDSGIIVNPVPNSTFFDLDMLHETHGVIEHDGSLSRDDIYFDLSNTFDARVFDNMLSYLPDADQFDVTDLAMARSRHAYDMSLANPSFEITEGAIPVIMGENAMILAVFGHPENPTANRAFVEYFFRNERLPVWLGWEPVNVAIGPTVGSIIDGLIENSPKDIPLTYDPRDPTSGSD